MYIYIYSVNHPHLGHLQLQKPPNDHRLIRLSLHVCCYFMFKHHGNCGSGSQIYKNIHPKSDRNSPNPTKISI